MTTTDYVRQLGYTSHNSSTTGPRAICNACGTELPRTGSIMRGHRRRCPVAPANPYTPAACDS